MLKNSEISKQEVIENADAVLEVLEFANGRNNNQFPNNSNINVANYESREIFQDQIEFQPLPTESILSIEKLISHDDPEHLYTNMKKIGEGAAGEVFVAISKKNDSKVAIKKMFLNNENLKLMMTEIYIMKSSRHANIVDYIDSHVVEDHLWVVMEYMSGGCLTEILEQFQYLKMTEEQIALVCLEVQLFFHIPLFCSYFCFLFSISLISN